MKSVTMNRIIFSAIAFLFIFYNAIAQKTKIETDSNNKQQYISLKNYKKLFKKELLTKDTLNFKFFDGDTLVLVENRKKISKVNTYNDKNPVLHRTAYMSLKDYRKIYKRKITSDDITHFRFEKGDTLVLISNKDFYKERVIVPYEPKDSTFLEIYKDVVYKKYSFKDSTKKNKKYMKLWKTPIKIYFAKSLDEYYKKSIIKIAKKVSKEIDSLQISFVNELENSNYIIYQIDDENSYQYEKRMSENKYLDYYLFWKKNKIYDAKLELNLTNYSYLSKKVNANYLTQNFIKTLGYFNTTAKLPCTSILSDCNSSKKQVTKKDLEILKYHYSYGICKFTDLETFETNHRKAKNTLEKTGKLLNFSHHY